MRRQFLGLTLSAMLFALSFVGRVVLWYGVKVRV